MRFGFGKLLLQKPTPKSGLASPSLPESSASLVEFGPGPKRGPGGGNEDYLLGQLQRVRLVV